MHPHSTNCWAPINSSSSQAGIFIIKVCASAFQVSHVFWRVPTYVFPPRHHRRHSARLDGDWSTPEDKTFRLICQTWWRPMEARWCFSESVCGRRELFVCVCGDIPADRNALRSACVIINGCQRLFSGRRRWQTTLQKRRECVNASRGVNKGGRGSQGWGECECVWGGGTVHPSPPSVPDDPGHQTWEITLIRCHLRNSWTSV